MEQIMKLATRRKKDSVLQLRLLRTVKMNKDDITEGKYIRKERMEKMGMYGEKIESIQEKEENERNVSEQTEIG